METIEKEKITETFEQMSLLSPQQLKEKADQGLLVVGEKFTPEEQMKISELAKKIDIRNRSELLTYGSGAQEKLTKFSNERLSHTNTASLEEAGDALTNLIVILKTYNPSLGKDENLNPVIRFFKQRKQDVKEIAVTAEAQLASVTKNLDEVEATIREKHLKPLVTRVKEFEEMHKYVADIYHELSMYIAAGQESLDYAKTVLLPEYDRKAQESGSKFDAKILLDFSKAINSFEGNLYCLETSRQLCIFNAGYIRQLQEKYEDVALQIRQFITQATPQWRIQMSLSLSVQDLEAAQNAVDAARNFTSNLFLANAEKLRDLSVRVSENANKPIIPIETTIKVNEIFIDMLDKDLEAQRKSMTEVREGRRINYEMEEQRNQALKEFAKEAAKIAVENAYINLDPSQPNVFDEIKDDGMKEATGEEPSSYTFDENPSKKYVL